MLNGITILADPIPEPNPAPAPEPNPFPKPGLPAINMKDVKCDGEVLNVREDVNTTFFTCFDKMQKEWEATGKKGFMPLQRLACGAVCAAQGLGLFDESGKPIKDNPKIAELINSILPAKNQKAVTEGLTNCMKKNSKKLKMKPGDCSSYGMMLFCMKESIAKICKL